MESKTLSKAEQLKSLVELRQSAAYQQLRQAAEMEVQQTLNTLLLPEFIRVPDAPTQAVVILGEMRGLRRPFEMLDVTIAKLTEEVKAEVDPPVEKPIEQQNEV